jgi:hypothetical protein
MNDLLANPAIQSGVAPFVVALLVLLGLRFVQPLYQRVGTTVAIWVGYFVAVELITDIGFSPLTSTKKIILIALIAALVGLLMQAAKMDKEWLATLGFVAGAAALIWILWPVLNRRSGTAFWSLAISATLYGGWLAASLDGLRQRPERAISAVVALGFGTGGAALLGASALLGSLGMALGAASAAAALWMLIRDEGNPGIGLMMPAGMVLGALGFAATIYAKVPWFALLPLATVPLAARIPLPDAWARRKRLVVGGVIAMLVGLAAVPLTWMVAGGVPM